jgi:hypothetical protein
MFASDFKLGSWKTEKFVRIFNEETLLIIDPL